MPASSTDETTKSRHKVAFEADLHQMLSKKKTNTPTFIREEYDKIVKFCQDSQSMNDESFKDYNKQLVKDNAASQGYQ